MVSYLLLLLLSSCATSFSQKWHPDFGLFGIIIIDGGHTLPSLCLRSAFAPKVEAKCIQKGMKPSSTLPIHLSDEPEKRHFSCQLMTDLC